MTLPRLNLALAALLAILIVAVGSMRTDRTQPNLELMPDMQYSPAYQAFNRNPNFANGRTLQAPPAGSIDRQQPYWDYDATPEAAQRAGEELINPFKVLAVLQTNIPTKLLEEHYAEQNPAVFGKREVILSLYLTGE